MSSSTLLEKSKRSEPDLPPSGGRLSRSVSFVFGWGWRIALGTALCFNFLDFRNPLTIVFSYATSIIALGWLQRWMQTVVLRGWWKQSGRRQRESFDEFCDDLSSSPLAPAGSGVGVQADAPAARPNWLVQQRVDQDIWKLPWHSLWLNFKIGFQTLACTYLITGWGCLSMLFSWQFGWMNSFNKGYEQAWVGPLFGLIGSILFILAMFYVPMAQAHMAATGTARAFFHFKFIWRLIKARPTPYLGLALLYFVFGLVFEVARIAAIMNQDFPANAPDISNAEALAALRGYFAWCTLGLFVSLLLLRGLTARVYRNAVLKALGQGRIQITDVPPRQAEWLERLNLIPAPVERHFVVRVVRWSYRRILAVALFTVWLVYLIRFYGGVFVAYHPYIPFLNHPLVHMPCIDYTPTHLVDGLLNY